MVVINEIKYESYYEVCKAFDISYAEFINFLKKNKDVSELDLLGHFIADIAMNMKTGEYAVIPQKNQGI